MRANCGMQRKWNNFIGPMESWNAQWNWLVIVLWLDQGAGGGWVVERIASNLMVWYRLLECFVWFKLDSYSNAKFFHHSLVHFCSWGHEHLSDRLISKRCPKSDAAPWVETIDIEYNKRLDRERPCLEDDFSGGSNNIVQSNKSVWRRW